MKRHYIQEGMVLTFIYIGERVKGGVLLCYQYQFCRELLGGDLTVVEQGGDKAVEQNGNRLGVMEGLAN